METKPGNDKTVLYENKQRRYDQFWSKMTDLRQSGSFCDVQLKVDKIQWFVHKVVLVTLSSYFYAMFSHDLKEKNQDVVEIHGLDVESVDKIIEYAYTGTIQINSQNVKGLLNAADMWELEDVKDRCGLFMSRSLNASNCLEFLIVAEAHSCTLLIAKSLSFAMENYTEVSNSDDFTNLDFHQLSELIGHQKSDVTLTPVQLYQSIMRWTKHKLDERQKHLIQLLSAVDFASMSTDAFKEIIDGEKLFQSSNELREFFTKMLYSRLFQKAS